MKPLKLKFSAFGPYAGTECLDFGELCGRTFFLIHGTTGAGKTTILDAICFALYGDSSGDLRDGKTMRCDAAAPTVPTEVEFEFALADQTYVVRRSPEQRRAKKRGEGFTVSPADAQIAECGADGEKLLAAGYSHTTAKVESLLGFKSGQFRQVVLLPQGEFRKLLTANSVERQEIMRTLFKTDLYQEIEAHLKRRGKEAAERRTQLAERRSFVLQELGAASPEALAESIAALVGNAAAEAQRLQSLETAQNEAQRRLVAGKVDEAKHQTLAGAIAEWENCEKVLPEVEKYRVIYQAAERGAQFEEGEARLAEAEKSVKKETEAQRQHQESYEILLKKLAAAQAALARETAREEERREAERQVLRLAELSGKAAELGAAQARAKETEQQYSAAQKQQQAAEREAAALKERLHNAREALRQATALAAGGEGCERAWAECARRIQTAELCAKLAAEGAASRAKLEFATAALAESEALYEAVQKENLRLRHLFTAGQAALLGGDLADGAPCPVCGALEHPRPAVAEGVVPDERELKAAERKLRDADKARAARRQAAAEAKTESDTLANRLRDARAELDRFGAETVEVDALMVDLARLETARQGAREAQKQLVVSQAEIAALEQKEKTAAQRLEAVTAAALASSGAREAARAVALERAAALPEAYRAADALARARQEAERTLQTLRRQFETAWEAERALRQEQAVAAERGETLRTRAAELQTRFAEETADFLRRIGDAGFADLAAYQAAKRPPEFRRKLEDRIRAFEQRSIAARDALAKAREAVRDTPSPEIARLEATASEAARAYNEAFAAHRRTLDEIARRREKAKALGELDARLRACDEAYGVIGTLADVANGKNEYGMTFQRYVLKSLLEDVIDASNLRLRMMSRGQYLLRGTDERARKNAAGGLEIEIFDNYTGYARPVTTLSGGEMFLASLSLALGLADVVQSYAGGIRLDTILVDEGFGTLDPESLDFALKALIDLQKGGRLVGIISHVPELRERIDARLEVVKTRQGSSARFCVG